MCLETNCQYVQSVLLWNDKNKVKDFNWEWFASLSIEMHMFNIYQNNTKSKPGTSVVTFQISTQLWSPVLLKAQVTKMHLHLSDEWLRYCSSQVKSPQYVQVLEHNIYVDSNHLCRVLLVSSGYVVSSVPRCQETGPR